MSLQGRGDGARAARAGCTGIFCLEPVQEPSTGHVVGCGSAASQLMTCVKSRRGEQCRNVAVGYGTCDRNKAAAELHSKTGAASRK